MNKNTSIDNIDVFNIEEQNEKLTEEQRRKRSKEIDDVRKILKTPEGRRFIWKLWSLSGIYRNPFNLNSNLQSFNSGRMSIGQELLIDVNEADVTAFAQMQNEHISALKSKKEAQDA